MTPKNAESSSALNVIVADATPPEENIESACKSRGCCQKRLKRTDWIQKGPPADVEGKPKLQTEDRSYSETHPWDGHSPDYKTHHDAHNIEDGASL